MPSEPKENTPTYEYDKLVVQIREFKNALNVPGSYDFAAGLEIFLTALENFRLNAESDAVEEIRQCFTLEQIDFVLHLAKILETPEQDDLEYEITTE